MKGLAGDTMINGLEMLFGRFNGGNFVAVGSYLNPRTMCIFQTTTDATLPLAGTWCRVDPSGTASFTTIATTLNTALGTSYTSGSFHAYTTADNVTSPGQMTNDA